MAQEAETHSEPNVYAQSMTPGSQHAYLAGLEGEWKATFWVWMAPGAPPVEGTGRLERSMTMGGRVLQELIHAELMGLPYEGVGHVGYDNVTQSYWATSFDNLSTGLTTLTGTIDESTGKATFTGRTPNPAVGDSVPMRLEIYYDEDGKQITETYTTSPDGEETLGFKTVYERLPEPGD